MAGALVIAGSSPQLSKDNIGVSTASPNNWDYWHICIASIPVLGYSPLARTAESMESAGLSGISILGATIWSEKSGTVPTEEQAWLLAAGELNSCKEKNLDAVVITRSGHYIECEWPALLEEHRKYGEAVSRGFDSEALWTCG